MLKSPTQCRDHSQEWFDYFHARRSAEIAAMVTPELIEEHRVNSDQALGHHSAELHLVLNYLRMAPIIGKEFVFAERPYERYRIGLVTARYTEPTLLDGTYDTETEAIHEVFLTRLRKIGVPV